MKLLIFAIFGLFVGFSQAEHSIISCTFMVTGADYDCVVIAGVVSDNENANITIMGFHQPGRGNGDVTRVRISSSFFSFIVRTFFDVFPNLRVYEYTQTQHPLRIQPNVFFNTPNLRTISITSTPLHTIPNNAFMGTSNLEVLNLSNNNISVIPQFMLSGVTTLVDINLSNNQIVTISDVALRLQNNLINFNINNNQLVRVPGNLLLTNIRLINFHASNNHIEEIGRRILDTLVNLDTLILSNNRCVNGQWTGIGGSVATKDIIRQQLETCFTNYGGPLEHKEFVMELRGALRLFDEYGNPIITL